MNEQESLSQTEGKRPLIYKIGLIMIVTSLVIWIIPLVVPFLPLSVSLKATIITVVVVVAEILFWTGAVFVGKEVAVKIRGYLNPKNWRKRKGEEND